MATTLTRVRQLFLPRAPGSVSSERRELESDREVLEKTGLFDADWYLSQNPDIATAGKDPISHYLATGASEGRDPNPLFVSRWYLDRYPDVAAAGMNPLIHFALFGASEGRDPNPYFLSSWYLDRYPDVAAAGMNPLSHFTLFGVSEGRNPHPLFDTDWYLAEHTDVAAAGMNPLAHYLRHGAEEGRNTSALKPNPTRDVFESAATYWDLMDRANRDLDPTVFGALSDRPVKTENCDVKLIAYYLPQFHPTPSNDAFWGSGFTEWTNVTRALPAFPGHDQPKLPGELGFYDLRIDHVLRRQIELAQLYGISAFCFHFYWFGAVRQLEGPLLSYLDRPELNHPFCLCWANENWTRRWIGKESEVLIGQHHSPEDDLELIRYLKRYFDDPRYLKIDGKPILTLYRPEMLPDAKATAELWRNEASAMGYPGFYLVATNAFSFNDPESIGFDALSEFPPHGYVPPAPGSQQKFISPELKARVYSYEDYTNLSVEERPTATILPGAMPGWDNTARAKLGATIFHGATPALFKKTLDRSIARARRNPPNQRIVMINAWNEWAEGACLEPDRRSGYAYLAACASALRENTPVDEAAGRLFESMRKSFQAHHPFAVVLNLSHLDMVEELSQRVAVFEDLDVYLSVPADISLREAQTISALFPSAYVEEVKQRGRDVRALLRLMEAVEGGAHQFVCKLTTETCCQVSDNDYRRRLMHSLLSPAARSSLRRASSMQQIGIIAAAGSLKRLDAELYGTSRNRATALSAKMGIEVLPSQLFVDGCMFWFRPAALNALCQAADDEFEPELGQVDGTLAHALGRMPIIIAEAAGYETMEFEPETGPVDKP